jgi:hypothetical protein
MTVIPCEPNDRLRAEIGQFAEALKTEAHALGAHGLDEKAIYESSFLCGAVEKRRRTTIRRGGVVVNASDMTANRRV